MKNIMSKLRKGVDGPAPAPASDDDANGTPDPMSLPRPRPQPRLGPGLPSPLRSCPASEWLSLIRPQPTVAKRLKVGGAGAATPPPPGWGDDDDMGSRRSGAVDMVGAARAVLVQAATLPLSLRQELLVAAAARLPELAPLFQTSAASTAANGQAPAAAPPPPLATATASRPRAMAVDKKISGEDLADLQSRLEGLARAVRASTPPPAVPAPAPASASLPAQAPNMVPPPPPPPLSQQQQQPQPQQGDGGAESMEVDGPAATEARAAEAAVAADALTVSVIPEYEQYGLTAEEPVRAVISLKAIAEVAKRAPVALTCVLDRSGSMCGEPIELVRQTVHFLIDQLSDDDWLGLVSFASDVREDLPLLRMSEAGRALAHCVTEALCVGGGTALYDGLVAGVRQQMAAEAELGDGGGEASRLVHSCFLFTDGEATDGPTTPADIISGLQRLQSPSRALGGPGVTVHTFGFGSNHSVELLQAVAEAQGGIYYYIQCTDDIASGFGDALGGLLAVVAKSVRLEVRPAAGVTLAAFRSGGRAIGGGASTTTAAAGGGGSLASQRSSRGGRRPPIAAGSSSSSAAAVPTGATFNDMFAEETRECLVVLNIPPAAATAAAAAATAASSAHLDSELMVVDMSYIDMATGARVSRAATLRVRRAAAARPAGQLPAELVFVTAARFETLDAIEAAQRAATAAPGDDVSGAHKVLDEQLGRLASSPLQVPAVSALMEQTRLARISIRPRKQMSQINVAAMAGTVQALRHQRVAISTEASPQCYEQYDYTCKKSVRRSARAAMDTYRSPITRADFNPARDPAAQND